MREVHGDDVDRHGSQHEQEGDPKFPVAVSTLPIGNVRVGLLVVRVRVFLIHSSFLSVRLADADLTSYPQLVQLDTDCSIPFAEIPSNISNMGLPGMMVSIASAMNWIR